MDGGIGVNVKKLHLFLITVCLLMTAVPAYCHYMPMAGSRWCLRENGLIVNIDFNQMLLSSIKGVKEGSYDLAKSSDAELQQIAVNIVQPYIHKKLAVTVNGKLCPMKVDRLVRSSNNAVFTIWLSADRIGFNRPENSLKIEYSMLFEETNNEHVNMAFLYKSDATGDALQKVFDYTHPEGQFNFEHGATVWELSVKGSAPVPANAPANAAVLPPAQVTHKKEVGGNAGNQDILSIQASGRRLATPLKRDVINQADSSHSLPAVSAAPQNRMIPADKVAVPQQVNTTQQVSPAAGASGKTNSAWSNIGNFILLGIEHILTGYDHIAFLIGLIVIGLSFREVLKIITAFTIAHSITLLLAALQIITLNSRFVESVIAFSICYIAVENLFRKKVQYRWVITFCFGLVHGFGFASALQELIVGKSNLILSVVSFNFGVETGQLMIFFILLPVMYLLRQKMEFRKVTVGVSMAVFVFGFTWLIERLFDLKLISS